MSRCPHFEPKHVVLKVVSLLTFNFYVCGKFMAKLDASKTSMASTPNVGCIVITLYVLIATLLCFVVGGHSALFTFLVPVVICVNDTIFTFLGRKSRFRLLVLTNMDNMLTIVSLVLTVTSHNKSSCSSRSSCSSPFRRRRSGWGHIMGLFNFWRRFVWSGCGKMSFYSASLFYPSVRFLCRVSGVFLNIGVFFEVIITFY